MKTWKVTLLRSNSFIGRLIRARIRNELTPLGFKVIENRVTDGDRLSLTVSHTDNTAMAQYLFLRSSRMGDLQVTEMENG